MSVETLELVRRAYEAFDNDLDGLLRLLDPAIEWVSPNEALEPGSRRGHQGVRDAFAATAVAWAEPTHTPEEFFDADDKVIVRVTFRGHGRGSGMDAERLEFHVWTVDGGLLARFEWFYDQSKALEAVGLREEDLEPAE